MSPEPTNRASAACVPPLVAGVTPCAVCRHADAEVTSDPGERWARHLCLDCADDEVERANVPREMLERFQAARENPRWRPLRPMPVDLATCDYTKLNALRDAYERRPYAKP